MLVLFSTQLGICIYPISNPMSSFQDSLPSVDLTGTRRPLAILDAFVEAQVAFFQGFQATEWISTGVVPITSLFSAIDHLPSWQAIPKLFTLLSTAICAIRVPSKRYGEPSSFLSVCQGGERGANGGEGKGFTSLIEEIFNGRSLIYGKEIRTSYYLSSKSCKYQGGTSMLCILGDCCLLLL